MPMNGVRLNHIIVVIIATGLLLACAPAGTPIGGTGRETSRTVKEASGEVQTAGYWLSKWQKDQPKVGGTLRRAHQLVAPSLDTIAEGTNGTLNVTMPVYNTLLEYEYAPDDKMGFPSRIVPGLAERWQVSADNLTYTFYLRKGIKWHDGKEFTSPDAKFSIERIMDPPPKTPSLRQGWYKGVVTKMETPDPYTFVITLNEPNAALIRLIATAFTPMVPRHILEPFNNKMSVTDLDKVVGTGPFKLVKGDRNVSWHLVRNENYWKKGRPYLDGIDLFVILEESTRVAAFKSGEVDTLATAMSPFSRSIREGLVRDMGDKAVLYPYMSVGGLGGALFFNSVKKPFDDVRIRKAIIMAIDWRGVEKIVYENDSCIGGYMPPGGLWGISCEEVAKRKGYRTPTAEDKAEAKRLLASAGYPDGFDVKVLTGYLSSTDQIAQLIQPMVAQIGVRVTLKNLERTAYYNAMNNGDFEMNPMGAAASIDDPNDHINTWVTCGAGRNYGKFCDQKVDELYLKQSREMDPVKRKQIYRELEERLLDLAPLMSSWGTGYDMSRSYVKGWLPMGGRLTQFLWETAWLDK